MVTRALQNLLNPPAPEGPFGIVATFETPGALLHAARMVRQAGFRRFDTFSPFPIHGMNRAMGLRPSLLPFIAFGGAVTGGLGGLALQWWINVVDYPLIIAGKPFNSIPAFIPVIFELTILLAAFGTVFGMFALNLLPRLYHPVFKFEHWPRATQDGFLLAIEARDARFDPARTRELLESLGGHHISMLEH